MRNYTPGKEDNETIIGVPSLWDWLKILESLNVPFATNKGIGYREKINCYQVRIGCKSSPGFMASFPYFTSAQEAEVYAHLDTTPDWQLKKTQKKRPAIGEYSIVPVTLVYSHWLQKMGSQD